MVMNDVMDDNIALLFFTYFSRTDLRVALTEVYVIFVLVLVLYCIEMMVKSKKMCVSSIDD